MWTFQGMPWSLDPVLSHYLLEHWSPIKLKLRFDVFVDVEEGEIEEC